LWLRGWGLNGDSDSIHYGLDGVSTSTSLDDCAVLPQSAVAFTWVSNTGSGTRPTITVSSAGLHHFDVWMRENGSKIDRLALTTDATYDPTEAEPPESGYGAAADCDEDGDVDLEDFAVLACQWSKCTDPGGDDCIDLH